MTHSLICAVTTEQNSISLFPKLFILVSKAEDKSRLYDYKLLLILEITINYLAFQVLLISFYMTIIPTANKICNFDSGDR